MAESEQSANRRGDPPWARLLFGEEPWLMLLAMLSCGLIIYILAGNAVPAILAVVLVGLAANAVCWRRAEPAGQDE